MEPVRFLDRRLCSAVSRNWFAGVDKDVRRADNSVGLGDLKLLHQFAQLLKFILKEPFKVGSEEYICILKGLVIHIATDSLQSCNSCVSPHAPFEGGVILRFELQSDPF